MAGKFAKDRHRTKYSQKKRRKVSRQHGCATRYADCTRLLSKFKNGETCFHTTSDMYWKDTNTY